MTTNKTDYTIKRLGIVTARRGKLAVRKIGKCPVCGERGEVPIYKWYDERGEICRPVSVVHEVTDLGFAREITKSCYLTHDQIDALPLAPGERERRTVALKTSIERKRRLILKTQDEIATLEAKLSAHINEIAAPVSEPGGGGGYTGEDEGRGYCERVHGHHYAKDGVCIYCGAEMPLFGNRDIPDGAGDPVALDPDEDKIERPAESLLSGADFDDDDLDYPAQHDCRIEGHDYIDGYCQYCSLAEQDDASIVHCLGCDRYILPGAPLQRCPACFEQRIASACYLEDYAAVVRKTGLRPEAIVDPRYAALPMPSLGNDPAYMTAAAAADLNLTRQKYGIVVYMRTHKVLAALRFGEGILLLCGDQYPINYYVVDPRTKLAAYAPVVEHDPDRSIAPVFPVVYNLSGATAFYMRGNGGLEFKANNGVIPLTVHVTFYGADGFSIGAVKLYWTDRRRMKRYNTSDHVEEYDLTPAGIRLATRARLHMEDRIMMLAKAPAGW